MENKANKKPKRNIKIKLYTVFFLIAFCVLAVSAFMLVNYMIVGSREKNAYKELAFVTGSTVLEQKNNPAPEPEKTPQFKTGFTVGDGKYMYDPSYTDYYTLLADKDMQMLHEKYKDIVAWLYIPGFNISYPVLYSEGDEYLYKNYKGEDAKSGSLFMFNDVFLEPLEKNITIHGHNMKNGTMFGSLKAYWLVEGMFDGAKTVYLDTIKGNYQYEIFSIYIENTRGDEYNKYFDSDSEYIRFINDIALKSKFASEYPFNFTAEDKILTLSTCTSLEGAGAEDRLIMHARLVH